MEKKIIIVGDLFPSADNEDLFRKHDVKGLLDEGTRQLFKDAEIAFCNMEGALTESAIKQMKLGPCIKAHPDCAETYRLLGITHVALANNHVTDFETEGFLQTEKAIRDCGLKYIGAGADINHIQKYIIEKVGDKRICFYNVAETMFNIPTESVAGVHLYDEYLVCQEIAALRAECDYIVVIYHGGIEFFQYPSPELKKRFHRMADSGADVVLAQHTHCIGCEEWYNGAYLLYGQGNFLFSRQSEKMCFEGLAIELIINDNGKLDIVKHHTTVSNGRVHLSLNPDYTQFEERGRRIDDNAFLESELKNFVMTQRKIKTLQFVKYKWYDKVLKKLLSPSLYLKYENHYRTIHVTHGQRMRLLYTLRSEQQRETALYIVLKELESE